MTEEIINFGAGPGKLPRETFRDYQFYDSEVGKMTWGSQYWDYFEQSEVRNIKTDYFERIINVAAKITYVNELRNRLRIIMVLIEIEKEFVKYGTSGISVMEMSHRSPTYDEIHNKTISLLKEFLNVPDNYKILLMHGGGRGAFSAVALNLLPADGIADYLVTGTWSKVAAEDAENVGKVNRILLQTKKGDDVPKQSSWNLTPNSSYVYYCSNETVEGFEFPFIPDTKGIPLVCDMSSNILTKEIDVSKYGVIIAASQKNIGPAGLAIVIIREDLIGTRKTRCPAILDFSVVAKSNSLINTPPTFTIYVCGKVLEYFKKEGGIKQLQKWSKIKSEILYNLIDDSNGFYINEVHPRCRSRVNVTFRIKQDLDLEKKFVALATQTGMIQLNGHRSIGGIRASLYSSLTVEEVSKLAGFMKLFLNEYELCTEKKG